MSTRADTRVYRFVLIAGFHSFSSTDPHFLLHPCTSYGPGHLLVSMSTATGSSTNILGPLTITFTQPSECTILFNVGSDVAFRDQACNGNRISGFTSCWPTPTPGADTSPQALSTWGVYSPGLVCPSDHTTACSFDGSASTGDYQFYYPPGSSETAIGCCPS